MAMQNFQVQLQYTSDFSCREEMTGKVCASWLWVYHRLLMNNWGRQNAGPDGTAGFVHCSSLPPPLQPPPAISPSPQFLLNLPAKSDKWLCLLCLMNGCESNKTIRPECGRVKFAHWLLEVGQESSLTLKTGQQEKDHSHLPQVSS